MREKVWRGGKKTHASSPSTSGKTHEKTCPIQTRRETRELIFGLLEGLSLTSLISYSPSNHSLSLRIYPVKISRLSKGAEFHSYSLSISKRVTKGIKRR